MLRHGSAPSTERTARTRHTGSSRKHRTAAATAAALLTLAALTGCTNDTVDDHDPTGAQTASVSLPPAGAAFDYQLGGAYEPDPAVRVVVRDRLDPPAEDRYSVCYVNAFQTQPGGNDAWPDDLLLHDADGDVVHDPDWPDEAVIDTRDTERVATVVTPWIDQCATTGYDAVEFDNLDTYTRTSGMLTRDDNLAVARILVARAHGAGLAAAQKNAAEDAALLRAEAGFDFAIAEECVAYDECDAYTAVYGDHVLDIEYGDPAAFADACANPDRPASLILRDRALTTPDDPGYSFELCP